MTPASDAVDAAEAAQLFRELLHEAVGSDARAEVGVCLLAVSGGPDSTALMHLAAAAAPLLPQIRFHAATVDHGLRPQARAEALQVAEQARSLDMPHHLLVWDGPKPTSGIQEAARETRYRLLEECAAEHGARTVMTAHTLGDQAETVLMRLVRGSGIDGLGGMRLVTPLGRALLLRPFLDIPKSRLLATCARNGWNYAQDPSNADETYGRVRIRRILALLAPEGLTEERLARLSLRARDASEALEICAARAFERARLAGEEEDRLLLDGAVLVEEPFEILRRVLANAIALLAEHPPAHGPRRERLDKLTVRLRAALRDEKPVAPRSLGGVDVAVDASRRLVLRRSPARRERVKPA